MADAAAATIAIIAMTMKYMVVPVTDMACGGMSLWLPTILPPRAGLHPARYRTAMVTQDTLGQAIDRTDVQW
jgi:hypothetical protein